MDDTPQSPPSPSWQIAYSTNAAPTERPPSPSYEVPSTTSTTTLPPLTNTTTTHSTAHSPAYSTAPSNPFSDTSDGFFLRDSLSPPPSSTASSAHPDLPQPRTHPLRSGSNKEAKLRQYVETALLSISRRYVKHFAPPPSASDAKPTPGFGTPYHSFAEVARDLDAVIAVLWRSGTPSIQIPYFNAIALAIMEYLPAFEPCRSATLRLIQKMDYGLGALVEGRDGEGNVLPGFEEGGALNRTDVVRLKGIVEGSRVVVMDVLSRQPHSRGHNGEDFDGEGEEAETDVDMDLDTETDTETVRGERREIGEEEEEEFLDVARVYENTLEKIDHFLNAGMAYDIGDGPGAG